MFLKLFPRYTKQIFFCKWNPNERNPRIHATWTDDTWPGSQWVPEVRSQAIILPSFICVLNESQFGTIQGPCMSHQIICYYAKIWKSIYSLWCFAEQSSEELPWTHQTDKSPHVLTNHWSCSLSFRAFVRTVWTLSV